MKLLRTFAVSALSLTLLSSTSFAQDRRGNDGPQNYHEQRPNDQRDQRDQRPNDQHDQGNHYVHHNDWKKGHRMNSSDWSRGQRVDYHQYHLAAPRRGYEWRQVDGNYVLAAVATGLIASVVIASSR